MNKIADYKMCGLSHEHAEISYLPAEGGSASGGKNSTTKLVVLLGENKNKIKRQIANSRIRIIICKNLRAAIKIAYRFAKNILPTTYHLPPTVILFSPGAASFDMFKNYADRGRQFKKLVKRIK